MKSNDLLNIIVEYINQEDITITPTFDFESFELEFSVIKDKVITLLKEKHDLEINLKNDFLKKVMNKHFILNIKIENKPFDKTYIRNKYSMKIRDRDVLYYPSKNPKRIIFSFSSMGNDKYDRYSRYWDETQKWESDIVYVFFKDEDKNYYLGTDELPLSGTYFSLIKTFLSINNLTSKDMFTIGTSMGGYAALYYGLNLESKGVIVGDPQINFSSTKTHEYRNWEKHITGIGKDFIDLDLLIHRKKNIPHIYIEYNNYYSDNKAVVDFLKSMSQKRKFCLLLNKKETEQHGNDNLLLQENITNIIKLFHSIKVD